MTFKKQAVSLTLAALMIAPLAVSVVAAQDATATPEVTPVVETTPVAAVTAIVEATATMNAIATAEVTPTAEATAVNVDTIDRITIQHPGLMPEGIEYDPLTDQFLQGSLTEGGVHHVAFDGTLTPFAKSDKFAASAGLEVDAAHNRLFVAASDATRTQSAGLGIFDLKTGAELAYVDLGAKAPEADRHFANDVAVDGDGNAYVTDSFAGVIYKVNTDNEAIVFEEDPSFKSDYALNGIAYNPGGYLIATRGSDLIRVELNDPQAFDKVESSGDFTGGDGLIFLDPQTLIVVSGAQNKVMRVSSSDNFVTASVTGVFQTEPNSATTAAIRKGQVYINYAQFNNPQATEYVIQKVVFSAAS